MKFSLVFLVTICTIVLATPVKKDGVQKDKAFLEKQKHVLKLLYHINQPTNSKEYMEIARTYSIEEHKSHYTMPEVVDEFLKYWRYDAFLPKGDIFSIMYDEHMHQVVILSKLFYFAKDWEVFYKTAVWARQHINERMFVYAFSVAILHRPDTQGIVLPAIYEITPHFFFNQEVMNMASLYKEIFDGHIIKAPYTDPQLSGFTINSNYSGWYLNLHPELSMSYYLEDIDMNAHYYYMSLLMPFWMNSTEFDLKTHQRGQIYLGYIQQLLARWNLERLSHGFGEVQEIDFDSPVELFYNPSLVYPNGLPFPSRPAFADLRPFYTTYKQKWSRTKYSYSLAFVKDYGRRIIDITDKGFALAENITLVKMENEEGLNTLGNIIECNNDTINPTYYGPVEVYARQLLGCSYLPLDSETLVPSVLEHYETSLRDPIIYQWMKKIVNWSQNYMMKLPPYTLDQLMMRGVEIKSVKMDPLITYMDHYYSDMTNAVWYNDNEKPGDFRLRVGQMRLNHKPFSYRLAVKSDKDQEVIVRVFLGPKYDKFGRTVSLRDSRLNFLALEHFVHNLKAGDNVIIRSSHDFTNFVPDRLPYWRLWRMVNNALNGTEEFDIPQQNSIYWPHRMMLPIGNEDGIPYQFFFFIYPYETEMHDNHRELFKKNPVNGHPILYPLNRAIKFDKMWDSLPNALFHEEKIYFKDIYDLKPQMGRM